MLFLNFSRLWVAFRGGGVAKWVGIRPVDVVLLWWYRGGGFGSMGFASHMGMATLGRLLTVGVVLTLLCYIVVLPSVLEWDDRRRQRRAG
jgi:hypothetical protein